MLSPLVKVGCGYLFGAGELLPQDIDRGNVQRRSQLFQFREDDTGKPVNGTFQPGMLLYLVLRGGIILNPLHQVVKTIALLGILNTSAITPRTNDKTIVFFLLDIDTNRNHHDKFFLQQICKATSTVRLTFVVLFHINRLAVFN